MDLDDLRRRFDRTMAGEVVQEFARIGIVDRSLALASKLFVAVIPLSIILAAVFPGRDNFGDSFADRFGLTGAGARATTTLFATDGEVRGALSAIGVVIILYSVFSFTRGLQAVYTDIWLLKPETKRALQTRAYWVLGFIAYTIVIGPLRESSWLRGYGGVYYTLMAAMEVAFWIFTPWLLLGGRVDWRRLVPCAALTAALLTVFILGSEVVLPTTFTHNAERYGLVGIAFGLVSWLFAYAGVVVFAAAVTGVWDRRRMGVAPPAREPSYWEKLRS